MEVLIELQKCLSMEFVATETEEHEGENVSAFSCSPTTLLSAPHHSLSVLT